MNIGVAVFIFGAILLLIALLGGGFEVRELKVPQVNQVVRMIATATGAIFIVTGIILGMRPLDGPADNPTTTPITPAPTTTAPPPAFPIAKEADLLLHVPKDFRTTCRRATSPPPQADAVVACTPSTSVNSVWYYVFSTTDKMYGWYFGLVDEKSIAHGSGDCKKDQVAESTYTREKNTVGHLVCYREGGKSYILWTYDKLAIAGAAYRNDLNDATLYQWWTTAGPLDPGAA
jgi:hypothetical protein